MHSRSVILGDPLEATDRLTSRSRPVLLKLPLKITPIRRFPSQEKQQRLHAHARSSVNISTPRIRRKVDNATQQSLVVMGKKVEGKQAPAPWRLNASTARTLSTSEISIHASPLATTRDAMQRSSEYTVTKYLVGKSLSPKSNFGYMVKDTQRRKTRRLFYNQAIENFLNRFEKKTMRVSLSGVALA